MSTANVQIKAPNLQVATFKIIGTAPYVSCKFSAKSKNIMRETQEAGSTAKGKKVREPKNFSDLCEGAVHRSPEGWAGIPAAAFRAGMISACRLVDFKMTLAKLSVFVEADGFDADDGVPLIRLIAGDYEQAVHHVRNATGVVDLRTRPMWRKWAAEVRIKFDGDQFTLSDVSNLLARVGAQVGIGEGRAGSKSSAGMGWGSFRLAESADDK